MQRSSLWAVVKENIGFIKKGLHQERVTMSAKKREYVTKHLDAPAELREFLEGEQVKAYVVEKAAQDPVHMDV